MGPTHEDNVTENNVVALYYTFTLKEGQEPITANNAWWNQVRIFQDTPTTINELVSANTPGYDYVMRMNDLVKPGASFETAISATIADLENPIEINFYNDGWNESKPIDSIVIDVSLLEVEN